MVVEERKSWEQMSGRDFKLDTEDKKGSRSELQMTFF